MSAIRKALETIHDEDFVKWGGLTGPALEQLNNSRDMTEKVTTLTRGWRPEASSLAERWAVTNHKARAVLDG